MSDPVAPRGLLFGQTVSILDDGPALPSQPQQSQLRQPRRERSVRSIGDRAALPAEQLARVAWVLGKARHELTWRVPELCELIARQVSTHTHTHTHSLSLSHVHAAIPVYPRCIVRARSRLLFGFITCAIIA